MASRPGSNTNFSRYYMERFAPLDAKLNAEAQKISKILDEALISGQRSSKYWQGINVEITKHYKEMERVFSAWAQEEIPRVYKREIFYWQKRIDNTRKIANEAKVSATALANSTRSSQVTTALYLDAIDSYSAALASGRRDMLRLTRLTQQAIVSESFIDVTIAQGFDQFGDLRKVADSISDQLYSKLLTQHKNLRYVRAGSRSYEPKYYAELVTRTKFHDAQFQAVKAQCGNYGTDLIRVSSHNTKTEICQEYEGKVFSLTGKDKRFPALDLSTPFHPNCLHLTYPEFESGLVADGTLQGFSDFSLGKVNRPPTPAGFIPLSKRGAA